MSRRSLIKLLCMSTLGMGLWVTACDDSNAGPGSKVAYKKASKMENFKSNSNVGTGIPPIDAAVPDQIKTATFALG